MRRWRARLEGETSLLWQAQDEALARRGQFFFFSFSGIMYQYKYVKQMVIGDDDTAETR